MRELRKQVHEAKGEYQASREPGDLARELLADRRRALVCGAWWVAGVSGAIAAMIAVVPFLHRSDSRKRVPDSPIVSTKPVHPRAYAETVEAIRGVPVSAYVMDVKSGMRQAVDQIAMGMDRAVESPVVKGGVQAVRPTTDEIE